MWFEVLDERVGPYVVVNGHGFVYYIRAEHYYHHLLSGDTFYSLTLLQIADFAIDLQTNEIKKCRVPCHKLVESYILRNHQDDVHPERKTEERCVL